MRFKEALDGWTQGRLTQAEAALLLGQCERSFRRHIERYQADGLDGRLDKRVFCIPAFVPRLISIFEPADRVARIARQRQTPLFNGRGKLGCQVGRSRRDDRSGQPIQGISRTSAPPLGNISQTSSTM